MNTGNSIFQCCIVCFSCCPPFLITHFLSIFYLLNEYARIYRLIQKVFPVPTRGRAEEEVWWVVARVLGGRLFPARRLLSLQVREFCDVWGVMSRSGFFSRTQYVPFAEALRKLRVAEEGAEIPVLLSGKVVVRLMVFIS